MPLQITPQNQLTTGQRGALIDHCLGGPGAGAASSMTLGLIDQGSGTGSATAVLSTPDATAFGVLDFQTGTTTSGRRGYMGSTTNFIFGGGYLAVTWRFQMPTLLDGTESGAVYFGWGDQSNAAPVDGAYVYWDNTQANFRYRTRSNSTETDVSSGLAPSAATWYTAKVAVNPAATAVTFTINGANAQTISTNIPTGVGRETTLLANIIKSAGTTTRRIYVDYCLLEWDSFNA